MSKNEEKILSLFETQKEFLSYVNIVCNRIKENLKLKYNFTNNAELTQLLENAFFEIEKLSFTNGQSYKDFMAKAHYDINLQGFLEAIGSLSFVHNFWERIENSSNILTDFIRLIKEEDKHDLIFHTILNHITPSYRKDDINTIEGRVISLLKSGFNITNSQKGLFKEFHKNNFYYLEAVRANTQRLYTWQSQGTAFNQLLLDLVKSNESWQLDFINHWLKEFGIGNELKVNINEQSIGAAITIDDKPLADLGYGVTQFLPILIKLVTIVKYEYWKGGFEYEDGWGFYNKKILYIEEPETNLHPKLQSKLADMLVDACNRFNLQIIVETHSEYLIRKLQYLTAKKEITPDMTVIHYFYDPKEARPEGEPQVKQINIQTDGRLTGQFGAGFYDETARLMTAILTGETLN